MHAGLARRYVEVSTQLLAPITPHTCDHVWQRVLGKEGSVLTAGEAHGWRDAILGVRFVGL